MGMAMERKNALAGWPRVAFALQRVGRVGFADRCGGAMSDIDITVPGVP